MDNLFKVTMFTLNSCKYYKYYGTKQFLNKISIPINIGFDQSSTQTGISIMDNKGNLLCVIDIQNCGMPSEEYTKYFYKWLQNNLSYQTINYIICERAEQNAPQQYVKIILQNLIKSIDKFALSIGSTLYQIDNKTWKKWYLSEEKFKGRRIKTSLVKPAIVEKTVDLYPQLESYYKSLRGTDSADAVGICYGFSHELFVKGFSGMQKICVLMHTFPLRDYAMEFLTIDEVKARLESDSLLSKMRIVMYNTDFTLEDNALRAINYYTVPVLLTTTDKKTLVLFKYTSDRDVNSDLALLVYRK